MSWAATSAAHPVPESQVWIDTTPTGLRLTLQLPLNRLEYAFHRPLADHAAKILPPYADELSRYLLQHIGARSGDQGWQALRPQLEVLGTDASAELQAIIELRAPDASQRRNVTLLYDVITHEVRTHRAIVFLRNDWQGGFVAQTPVILGEFSFGQATLPVNLVKENQSAVMQLIGEGAWHIAQGLDHLLFLVLLLLVAPLAIEESRWGLARPRKAALRHIAAVVTAFTVGHSITLALASTGLLHPPMQLIEIAVAMTIALAAIHAWHPTFQGVEAGIALCFGLIHGFAFSSALSGAGLNSWQHGLALLYFNIGIEIMQLVVVILVLPPLLLLAGQNGRRYGRLRQVCAVIAFALSIAWILDRSGLINIRFSSVEDRAWAIILALSFFLWLVVWRSRSALETIRPTHDSDG